MSCTHTFERRPSGDYCTTCGAFRGQLGHEPNADDYVKHLMTVLTAVHRVLKDEGSLYLNISDTYHDGALLGIPDMVCAEMRVDGWRKLEEIVWVKTNGMPESVSNRFSRRFEYLFHFVKSKSYFGNIDLTRIPPLHDRQPAIDKTKFVKHDTSVKRTGNVSYRDPLHSRPNHPLGKNPGNVWEINCAHEMGPHPAVYPLELCYRPMVASCPPGGTALDPFCGIGTTLVMAKLLRRPAVGIEINPQFAEIARENLASVDRETQTLSTILDQKEKDQSFSLDAFVAGK
jgi:DNA modification methylase